MIALLFISLYFCISFFLCILLISIIEQLKCYKILRSIELVLTDISIFLNDNTLRKAPTYSANSDLSRYKCYELSERAQ